MKVLLAFDKFKGSLTAQEACRLAEDALFEIQPDLSIEHAPLSDGGEGFCSILTEGLGGEIRDYTVTYPEIHPGSGQIGYVPLAEVSDEVKSILKFPDKGILAIIEMAQAAGHQLIQEKPRNPWSYTTFGVGEMIRYAIGEGCTHILMGMGGSATNDMGIGMLEALGLKAFGRDQQPISPIVPSKWNSIREFKLDGTIEDVPVCIACDVKNPLHGPNGAAAIYGPQKGLLPEGLNEMQLQMERMDPLVRSAFEANRLPSDTEGMGAAGGMPFGVSMAFDTHLVPGFELLCEILKLDGKVENADWVLTGEGAVDLSSLSGKGPFSIVQRAFQQRTKVSIMGGKVFDDARESLNSKMPEVDVRQIGDPNASIDENISNEPENLKKTVQAAFGALKQS